MIFNRASSSLLQSSSARARQFSTSFRRDADFTHAVIGAGVVGLAIARKLQSREDASVVLIEKHGSVGTETSSRNSEVIHAGLYYGTDSLKTKLCLKGKDMMYELCKRHSIPHRNTGKWIVAQDATQMEALEKVHILAASIGVPTHFISKDEAKRREPDVRAEAGVLESPTTGIVDSHSLMQYLEGDFQDQGGFCATNTSVTSIAPYNSAQGAWEINTKDRDGEQQTISAETLINAAGLYAVQISNMVLAEQRKAYYAKGSYFSYSSSRPKPSTLIYPAPVPGHGGLGTHLTLDLSGRIRFGPDVEWTDSPTDYSPNTKNLAAAIDDIATYLPGIDRDAIQADYVGIRPKLGRLAATSGTNFQDFYIKKEEETGGGEFVNLLAIESPGLTSCLAIAEEVEGLLYR